MPRRCGQYRQTQKAHALSKKCGCSSRFNVYFISRSRRPHFVLGRLEGSWQIPTEKTLYAMVAGCRLLSAGDLPYQARAAGFNTRVHCAYPYAVKSRQKHYKFQLGCKFQFCMSHAINCEPRMHLTTCVHNQSRRIYCAHECLSPTKCEHQTNTGNTT